MYGASIALVAALALLASACAEDDPIGLFDETTCDLQPADGTSQAAVADADDHADDDADDHADDDADDHADGDADDHADDDADDHADESVVPDFIVEMDMLEFGYSCSLPTLAMGTVLQFEMVNVGAVEHEAVFGDLAAQEEAEAAMSAADDDDDHADHDTPSLVLAAGQSGTVIVMLDTPGQLIIGCHIPGHWDAGMRSDSTVSA